MTSTAPLAWRPTSPVSSVSCARPPRRESQRAAAKYRRRRRALCRPGSRSARPQAHLPAAHVYRNPVRHQLQHAAAALLRRARVAAPPGRPRAAPPGAARRLCRPRLAGRALAVAAGLVPRCRGAAGACLVRRCGRPGRSGPRAMLQQGGHRAVRQARRKRRLLVTVMQAWMSHRASEGWPPWTLSGSGRELTSSFPLRAQRRRRVADLLRWGFPNCPLLSRVVRRGRPCSEGFQLEPSVSLGAARALQERLDLVCLDAGPSGWSACAHSSCWELCRHVQTAARLHSVVIGACRIKGACFTAAHASRGHRAHPYIGAAALASPAHFQHSCPPARHSRWARSAPGAAQQLVTGLPQAADAPAGTPCAQTSRVWLSAALCGERAPRMRAGGCHAGTGFAV